MIKTHFRLIVFVFLIVVGSTSVFSQYKGDLLLNIAMGYRTDETTPVYPFRAPPDRIYNINDGTNRYWMGGFILDCGIGKSFFKRTVTGVGFRPSFHNIENRFFIMPNWLLFHDWYYPQKAIDNRWLFGLQVTLNTNRVVSSGEPIFPGGPLASAFDYRSLGLGIRGGRLLAQKGVFSNTYLKGELTWIIGSKERYPGEHAIQMGLTLSKNFLLNAKKGR